jgi:hypothetical protein
VVDVICRNIGQLDLRLYEEVDESERQPKPDHPGRPVAAVSERDDPADKLIRSLFKDFLLFDNAYALLTPAPGTQINFNRMPAHMVEIRGASMFQAEGYRFHLRDGTFVDFAPEQVLHWAGENPSDPRMGVSKLDTLRQRDRGGRGVAAGDRSSSRTRFDGADVGFPPARRPGVVEPGP